MKIGITYTGSDEKQENYISWLNEAGNHGYELITLHASHHLPDLSGYAGLIFSGGVDIHPSYYGQEPAYANAPATFNDQRDEFEKGLFQAALEVGLPVLGICRGMQLINVLLGGTLTPDLGPQGNEIHRAVPADKEHMATLVEGTNLQQLLSGGNNDLTRIHINSAHHQAVDLIADDLRISCYSADGIPEALEWKEDTDRSFLLCVQWHPERMFRFGLAASPASARLRNAFLNETKNHLAPHENHQSSY